MHVIKTCSLVLKTNFSYLNTFVRFFTDLKFVSLCNDLHIVRSLDVCRVTYILSFCVIIYSAILYKDKTTATRETIYIYFSYMIIDKNEITQCQRGN